MTGRMTSSPSETWNPSTDLSRTAFRPTLWRTLITALSNANDMVAGIGDFAEAGPQPNQVVDVKELDRSAYLINL